MIRPGPFPDREPTLADRRSDLDRRPADLEDGAAGRGRADARLGTRSDAFESALRRHDTDDAVLAAAAAAAPPQIAALPQVPPATAVADEAGRPSERILAVAEASAQALATELHLRAGRPVSVELTPEGAPEGIGLLRVTLEADRLRVEVAPIAGTLPDPGLLEAARSLADRLSRRFPRRLVEVAELPAVRGRGEA